MNPRQAKFINVFILTSLFLFICQSAFAASPLLSKNTSEQTDTSKTAQEGALMERLKSEDVGSIMASLSDEQVRRLLLMELQKQADQQALDESLKKEVGGLAGFIHNIKVKVVSFDINVRRDNTIRYKISRSRKCIFDIGSV